MVLDHEDAVDSAALTVPGWRFDFLAGAPALVCGHPPPPNALVPAVVLTPGPR